jgi:hypothetical protein
MSCQRIVRGLPITLATLLLSCVQPAWAAGQMFETDLDPFAFTPVTRANVVGIGKVSATLDGNTLTITGKFSELSSAATGAHLRMGLAMGVPGPVIGELTVTHESGGTISGTVTLNEAQVAALRHSAVYVQLESVKTPDGTLWGWFEPH